MKINDFAQKTGIPSSTLRFYDRKQVLVPEERLANGYRMYTENQIKQAQFIHSLRQADVSITDIQLYLTADHETKSKLVRGWRENIESKLSALHIAQKYLGGFHPENEGIYLVKWNEPRDFIWFTHTVERKMNPFHAFIESDRHKALQLGLTIIPEIYIRTHETNNTQMTGEIGFQIKSYYNEVSEEGINFESYPPTLFTTIKYPIHNEYICFHYMKVIQQYGFIPKGQKMERYESEDATYFQLMIPVMHSVN
ncbi:MerR family transcriptional regulator [Bacillus sp. SM2101]|uniref:helix-turn-helix domain-containing protein n=1 Tax=Bacillus sp. SM2101 TaxID=2805366 RepID=UPI001BDF26EB|nr:MerR family transcriptional regulator [Bacillus sp. SM2101]